MRMGVFFDSHISLQRRTIKSVFPRLWYPCQVFRALYIRCLLTYTYLGNCT